MHDFALALTEPVGTVGSNPFGKDVANASLFRALINARGDDPVHFCLMNNQAPEAIAATFGLKPERVRAFRADRFDRIGDLGCLIHGLPNLYHFAWLRSPEHAQRYSLVGLIHTLAPPATQEVISRVLTSPTQPWDALICTSRAVRKTTESLLDSWGQYFKTRFGGTAAPTISLPIIPLGVDCNAFAPTPERRAAGKAWRERLGIGEDDIAILWMGRLSFFEKMHPFATLAAVEAAAQRTQKKLHLLFAGWFPHEEHRAQYVESARRFCPSAKVTFLNGGDPAVKSEIWFAADIFTSLVDNVQETFGIAPVEAMASGLPSVVSDWDGYRDTVSDGEVGFRIPTTMPPEGAGLEPLLQHLAHLASYQGYVGAVSQGTAVDIPAAADAFVRLADDAALRRQMGEAGRTRALQVFDWPVVARQYMELLKELAVIRNHTQTTLQPLRPNAADPFTLFANFATSALADDAVIALADGATGERLTAIRSLSINIFARPTQGSEAEVRAVLDHLRLHGPTPAAQLASLVPGRDRFWRTLGWLLKMGLVARRPNGNSI